MVFAPFEGDFVAVAGMVVFGVGLTGFKSTDEAEYKAD